MSMKKYCFILLFGLIILISCTQKPAEIVYKKDKIYSPNYSEVYVESPDGKIARSLRGNTNIAKAQKVSIINKNAIKETSNNYYTVKSGDSLWSIARNYDMKVIELAELNDLNKPYNIKPGQNLKISGLSKNQKVPEKLIKKVYTVKSGDNLSSIASDYKMTTKDLANLNNIDEPYNIRIGQKLTVLDNQKVIVKASQSNASNINQIYIVKSGDNLSTIASKYNTDLGELAKLNNLERPYNIKIGQRIKLNKNSYPVKSINKPTQLVENKSNSNSTTANKKNSFIWPVKGQIVSSFGNKANGLYNDGINISSLKGTNFKATEDGVVAYVGNELRGYGTIILIKHNNNWISAYAHCDSVRVSRGDKVQQGQILGTVGQTGNVASPQLYFSLRSGREAVDPIKYLN